MIPFLDLKAQYNGLAPEIEAAVLATMRDCTFILGEPVAAFERGFARLCGSRHAIAVSSGTSALHLALLAEGIGPGDEVITTPTTFVATVAAILYVGATPVFVDIDPETWNLDPGRIEAAITPRTRAIMPVHFHGRLADMTAICAVAEAHGLVVIEDAAQAVGAMRDGRGAGTFGRAGCFSFYPGKNLGAAGEGGMVVTDDDDLADLVRSYRDWGQVGKHNHVFRGHNYRMDAIQGAVLGVKLPHVMAWNTARRAVANCYGDNLAPVIRRAAGPFGTDHSAHVYAVRVPDRARLQAELTDAGIGTNIHYPKPVHLHPAYADLGYGPGDLPHAEAYARETLSLPLYPELAPLDIERVIAAMNTICDQLIPA
ncbi:DegT/DnrJ/EryC1/StrS family aminotransferase [Pseudooceanicola sp. LIPI14-2-Ac024]|uniref:DegT/DnrJ/EryC1/StrS family aminotransferase n=1 Tax=Pseudooceanicola sp. LIPI14-2-Ac024 TaxID=3344875 RepID=UPI0035CF67CB